MLDPSRIEAPDEAVVAILRRMSEAERLTVANRMWVAARQAVEQIVRQDYPQWSDDEVLSEIGRRMLRGSV